jgi:adenine specific DNA methylase Mod
MTRPDKLTAQETNDKLDKMLMELQLILRSNTSDGRDNSFVLLQSTAILYTMVSKKLVSSKSDFLFNSDLAWDSVQLENMQEVTFQ